MKKRLLALILATTLVISTFSACNSKTTSSSDSSSSPNSSSSDSSDDDTENALAVPDNLNLTGYPKGIEHGTHIIEALETGRIYRGHFNVVNNGTITNLPNDAVVEVPGYVDRTGLNIPVYGDLPLGCAAICNVNINVQRLAVKAAITGDEMLLKQAMMMDPLTGSVLFPDEICQMTDEMLIACEEWLPQYTNTISAAKIRLENNYTEPKAKKSKNTIKKWKTIEEIRLDDNSKAMFNKAAYKN